jgi:hypothetical protein
VPVFAQVLERYYGGVADEATDARLALRPAVHDLGSSRKWRRQ